MAYCIDLKSKKEKMRRHYTVEKKDESKKITPRMSLEQLKENIFK